MKEMKKEPIDNSRIELTEKIHEELLSLPLSSVMALSDLELIVNLINKY